LHRGQPGYDVTWHPEIDLEIIHGIWIPPGIQYLAGFSVHQHVNGRTDNLSRAGGERLPWVDTWTSWTEAGSEQGQNFAGVRGPGCRDQGKVARMNNHGAEVVEANLGRTQGSCLPASKRLLEMCGD
jgi:hypothetical protein